MINIDFDKRLELIFGLQYCVLKDTKEGYNIFFETNREYCNDFLYMFDMHASEDLINYIKLGGFDTYDRTASIALLLDEKYCLDEKINDICISKNFNKKKLEALIQRFVKESNYEEFFKSHKNYYEEVKNLFKNKLNKYVIFDEKLITDFYGYKLNDFEIKLYDFTKGSFGLNINNKSIYIANFFPCKKDNEIVGVPELIIKTLFHEFSHPYCNPLGYKYFKNVDITNIINETKRNGLESSYNGISVINEYVVRAVDLYLSNLSLPKGVFDIDKSINNQKKKGYVHIDSLIKLFSIKNKYKNFEDFYKNEIVNFFIEIDKI